MYLLNAKTMKRQAREWRKYLQITCIIMVLNPDCMKEFLQLKKINNTIEKTKGWETKDLNIFFNREDIWVANHIMFNIISHQGNAN